MSWLLAYPEEILEHMVRTSHCQVGSAREVEKRSPERILIGNCMPRPLKGECDHAHQLSMAAGGMHGKVQVLWSPNEAREFATYGNELKLYTVISAEVSLLPSPLSLPSLLLSLTILPSLPFFPFPSLLPPLPFSFLGPFLASLSL